MLVLLASLILFFAIFFPVVQVILFALKLDDGRHALQISVVCCLGVAAAGAIAVLVRLFLQAEVRCYELGMERTTSFGKVLKLRLDEIESLSFSKNRHYSEFGTYLGTYFSLQVHGSQNGKTSSIGFHIWVNETSAADALRVRNIQAIRDRVVDVIADRMIAELDRAGIVLWTPFMRITRDGVECLAKRGWQLVHWGQFEFELTDDAWFKAFDRSSPTPVISVGQVCPNFYPGLLLISDRIAVDSVN